MDKNDKQAMRLKKLKERFETERERVKAYEQVVQIYAGYMALLLRALGATKDEPFKMTHSEISAAMAGPEVRAIPADDGISVYIEEVKENA